MLDDLAGKVKSLDPNHLVGTSVSALECLSPIASAKLPQQTI